MPIIKFPSVVSHNEMFRKRPPREMAQKRAKEKEYTENAVGREVVINVYGVE